MTTETLSPHHKSMEELRAALPYITASPKNAGEVKLIVSRPRAGERRVMDSAALTLAKGVEGDHWSAGCWLSTDDGAPHPDVQICMMNARCIEAIAGDPENWPPAGDNLFIDMDLTPANMPPGTRIAIGSAELVITPERHNGCASFIERFGRDACLFVNLGTGKELRLRGIYGRVTKDGEVRQGDRVRKLG